MLRNVLLQSHSGARKGVNAGRLQVVGAELRQQLLVQAYYLLFVRQLKKFNRRYQNLSPGVCRESDAVAEGCFFDLEFIG